MIKVSRQFCARKLAETALAAALALSAGITGAAAQTAPPAGNLEPEQAFTHKLPAPSPHWVFMRGGWENSGTRIWDGDSGKMLGLVQTTRWSDMALDPAYKAIYVAETIWTKINRGTRQDYVAVYDPMTLNLLAEIPLPGRLIIGAMNNNFVISDDGKTGFVYNFSPASSVNVVDLEKRRLARVVELPGCASLVPVAGIGFSALCSDGTLATVSLAGKAPVITHSAAFFKAAEDPVFDSFVHDRSKGEIVLMSYTGLIRTAKLGATPTIGDAWSIQAAAGLRPGDTKPLDINWMPGGRQLTALHEKTGTLYVLMHRGEYWTQKEDGEEIWVVNMATRKVVKRVPIKNRAGNIAVSQDDKPLIFLTGGEEEGEAVVLDALTFEEKHKLKRAGSGVINTLGAR
ncbi:amine dehydrogenase large subunit [Sandarakinorhabdus rubra]|uniref:amine dehydrogenase large subunit n=1 Tax=Sandarakinorhabdus rubra TaxID=2672568 RepID=UPI0013D9DA0A|nr:amine dehydrogenase large subunit [Sandarakinorhabdus rubra]